ncbi:hypothetical protein QQP08_018750 [Theobroma cacao]|uniref:Uncharacterized protein n=1 Tax=Theobroma cacao TaxID=3641 RepID=A0A061GFK4_THECC|nr:Uncharacterized protein TCM_029659 [Theobroma cacao]WRX26263.1 hypothetical protein QQP08_018750 [Theobroma cacao]
MKPNVSVATTDFLCFIHVYKSCFAVFGPLMDGSRKVMESLDSLWFFNNVLTITTLEHKGPLDEDIVKEEVPSKHNTQSTSQDQQNEAPSTEILVPRCPKCGEIAVEFEHRIVQPDPVEEVEFARPTEKSERRRRRRRRKRSKRKVLGELDLGFHGNLASESWFSEETYGYPNSESQHYTKMPPLNDGLAMKEHLKSWAYAVACTVR